MSQEPKTDWQPCADVQALKARADLYQQIRDFFSQRGVLEVETPLMGRTNSPDLNIDPFILDKHHLVLQTSPEFFMKRLLCAGSGSIYQICKAFRQEEAGSLHNPEFSLLEWYRVGYTHLELIDEVQALLVDTLKAPKAQLICYRDLFVDGVGLDPFEASDEAIQTVVNQYNGPEQLSQDQSLDFLFTIALDKLDNKSLWVVTDFPASQAALARIDKSGEHPVAKRFEFYYKGLELANGYYELNDAQEQSDRFASQIQSRAHLNKPSLLLDDKLISALDSGMPECAGVALGLDRLLMLKLKQDNIDNVIAFGFNYL